MSSSLATLRGILERFPVQHLVYGFAYGPGAFRSNEERSRRAKATARTAVDLMLVTRDTESFHRDNMDTNRAHYSGLLGRLGPYAASAVQTRFGAKAYFNAGVRIDGCDASGATFGYGVIDARDFRRDLQDWTALYAAGRMLQPVVTLLPENACDDGGPVWSGPLRRNLRSAVHAALLQMPETFSETQLYATAAGLSRGGGCAGATIAGRRGRDGPNAEVDVRPRLEEFRSLYRPVLETMGDCLVVGDTSMQQDTGPDGRLHHLRGLPQTLKDVLCASFDDRPSPSPSKTRDFVDDHDGGLRDRLNARLNGQLNRMRRDLRDRLLRARGWTVGVFGTLAKRDEDDAVLAELAKRAEVGLAVRDAVNRIVVVSSVAQSLKNIPTYGVLKSVVHGYRELNDMLKPKN